MNSTSTLPLLDGVTASSISDRQPSRTAIIKQAFSKIDRSFRARYEAVMLEHGRTHADFIAGEVTDVYESRHGKLTMREQKQLGGLYIEAQKRGTIVKTNGSRKRNQGNLSAIYRLQTDFGSGL